MDKYKDRDNYSPLSFPKEAGYGIDWGMRATPLLGKGHAYQDVFNAFKISQNEVQRNRESAAKMDVK